MRYSYTHMATMSVKGSNQEPQYVSPLFSLLPYTWLWAGVLPYNAKASSESSAHRMFSPTVIT